MGPPDQGQPPSPGTQDLKTFPPSGDHQGRSIQQVGDQEVPVIEGLTHISTLCPRGQNQIIPHHQF